jgi:voltage-gated potassium channel
MYILLRIFYLLKINSWFNIGCLILCVYILGSTLIIIEPETFGNISDYTWWFIVTSSTVGYGDLYPSTDAGRLIGVVVIFGGVGSLAMVIGKLSELIMNVNKIRIKGLKNINMKNHTVLMGYHKEETQQIVDEILKDDERCNIIICSDEIDEDPFLTNDCVSFVRGKLISDDVLERACVKDASKILIHAPNDNESIAVLLAVLNTNTNKDTNIVLTMHDAEYNKHVEELVKNMDRCVETITELKTPMMVQSLLDSGASDIINQILSNDGSKILSSKYVGPEVTFTVLFNTLERENMILIGCDKMLHPQKSYKIKDGSQVYYLGHKRMETIQIK